MKLPICRNLLYLQSLSLSTDNCVKSFKCLSIASFRASPALRGDQLFPPAGSLMTSSSIPKLIKSDPVWREGLKSYFDPYMHEHVKKKYGLGKYLDRYREQTNTPF